MTLIFEFKFSKNKFAKAVEIKEYASNPVMLVEGLAFLSIFY